MSRTVTALFDSREDAEAARTRLSESHIDADRVRIIDQQGSRSGSSAENEGEGFWASVKSAFMPIEDSHAYEEGMRRGSYLLCAEVEEDEADRAIQILDSGGSVDFDQRQEEWRKDGWSSHAGGTDGFSSNQRETEAVTKEERIPIVEEELRVGKREIERGGARVRSYVRETPVHEQVNLREEHVSIERQPVDQPLGQDALNKDSDLFRERNIEMTEHSEEAVVDKEARVREELVIRKTAEEHVERIDDSVRHTEVDVKKGLEGAGDRSAFGSFGNGRESAGSQSSDFETEEQIRERARNLTDASGSGGSSNDRNNR